MPRKLTQEEFIKRAREVHGDKYDYSKVEYVNANSKVCIICSEHGEFWQKPASHLLGCGCIECAGKKKYTKKIFIEKAKKVHGDKYDYSKVEYANNKTKVCIICPEHGEFWQKPESHIVQKRGCPYCGGTAKLTLNDFIRKSDEIHKHKYDYSKVEYVNYETKVCIICPEHGEFWQTPHGHLNGQGCPYCKNSYLANEISILLKENKIIYEQEKTFEWLRDKGRLYLDFYLPDYNIAIECQGEQHFKPVDFFGGEEQFKRRQELDFIKHKLCINNGIKIIYYSTFDLPYFAKVENNKEKILNLIIKKDG